MNELEQPPKDTSQSCVFDFPDRPGRPVPPIDPNNPPNPPLEYPYEPVLDWPPIFPVNPIPGQDPIPGSNPHPYPSAPPGMTLQAHQFFIHDYNDDPTALDLFWSNPAGIAYAGENYAGGGR